MYGDRKRELIFSIPCQQALVDELEQRINFCHTKGMEDEEDYERASKAVGAATGNKPKKSAATPAGLSFNKFWLIRQVSYLTILFCASLLQTYFKRE